MNVLNDLFEDLVIELNITEEADEKVLYVKIKRAIAEVRNRRDYPSHFTEDDIQSDLNKLYSNIHDLALYDYNQIGAEGETSHSESGVARTWKDRESCLKGVFAWAGF